MHLKIYFIKQFFGINLRFYVNAFSFNGVVILDWVYHLSNRRDDFQIYFLGEKWSLLSRESTWKQSWGKRWLYQSSGILGYEVQKSWLSSLTAAYVKGKLLNDWYCLNPGNWCRNLCAFECMEFFVQSVHLA